MKAVVLEIKNGYAAVLREDGVVVKIRRRCEVGETILLSPEEAQGIRPVSYGRMIRNIAIAAAVVLVVLGGSSTYYLTATSAATVEVDTGDTMVTLSLNHFNRVIGISSGQEEDAELISAIDAEGIRNSTLEEALQKTAAVISGRNGTDAEDSTEKPAEITIRTANDTTYEHLRGQAEKGGFSVKRKEDADDGRSGHKEQEFSAVPMEDTTALEAPEDMDVSEDRNAHAAEDVHSDIDMDAEAHGTDRQEQVKHGIENDAGETGLSGEEQNGQNEAAQEHGGDSVSEPAQEGENHEPAQEGESSGQAAENDTGQKTGPGDSQGDSGEGQGMRP